MKYRFYIEYFATNEQLLHIVFSNGTRLPMLRCGGGMWSVEYKAKPGATYHYELCTLSGAVIRSEEHEHRTPKLLDGSSIYDCWWDKPSAQPFYSSFFTDSVFRRKGIKNKHLSPANGDFLIEVEAPTLSQDEALAIVGGSYVLGGWDTAKSIKVHAINNYTWQAILPHEAAGSEYKFIITDTQGNFQTYEEGCNRLLPHRSDAAACMVRGLRLRHTALWRGAGVAIPLFSLRSQKSWGVGEFSDLKLMIRWAKQTHLSVIQVLPVNDTSTNFTWRDSYPYNAISSFALHPLYLGAQAAIDNCARLADNTTKTKLQALYDSFTPKAEKLNALDKVYYDKAIKLKIKFLKSLYRLCGEQAFATKEFMEFLIQSQQWLLPYAVYCSLRDKHSTTDFRRWKELSSYNEPQAYDYALRHKNEVGFYCFVQYLLDRELCDVHRYAQQSGIALKGDIPIGVSPNSVDVWCAPELYNTAMSAGAPPDIFAEEGQNWGFPTYNWERMAEDGYDWWRRRLQKMSRYFDAYRIDHILGFFRIWEVPRKAPSAILGHFYPSMPYTAEEINDLGIKFNPEKECPTEYSDSNTLFVAYPEGGYTPRIEGYKTERFKALTQAQQQAYMHLHEEFFYHRHNDFWRACALKRLPALMAATKMLTCGEDLGMIPACVPEVMSGEGILSLEIERMPKQMGQLFGDTLKYPYFSVTAPSTHDMSNIRSWWEEDRDLTQHYWSDILHLAGTAEKECSAATARLIIERQMRSASMLAILPLQDWLAMDKTLRGADAAAERINVPADLNHYWRYRMHITLEQLLKAKQFSNSIKELVALR